MAAAVALVGTSPELAALRQLLGAEVALEVRRTTADHVEQAVGPRGMAVLDFPKGESREFARALVEEWSLCVLDLGPDLRAAGVTCAFDAPRALGKRLAAMPSAAALAAYMAAAPLIRNRVSRLAVHVFGGGGSAALNDTALADELGWIFDQDGLPPTQRVALRIGGGEGLVATVLGGTAPLSEAWGAAPSWVRTCPPGMDPDASRLKETDIAEVAVVAEAAAGWSVCACAIDPVWFRAHAALRALRAMAG